MTLPFNLRYYQLKRGEQLGDLIGPVAVTVLLGAHGRLRYLEHRVVGPRVEQRWLLPLGMVAE